VDHRILIIFGITIPDTTGHLMVIYVVFCPTCASALPIVRFLHYTQHATVRNSDVVTVNLS